MQHPLDHLEMVIVGALGAVATPSAMMTMPVVTSTIPEHLVSPLPAASLSVMSPRDLLDLLPGYESMRRRPMRIGGQFTRSCMTTGHRVVGKPDAFLEPHLSGLGLSDIAAWGLRSAK